MLSEHSLLQWSPSVWVFPCCGQGCSLCLIPLNSVNGRNGFGRVSALPWLGSKSLAAGPWCCFSEAGHELPGLLLLWLCSDGPLQQSPSHPGMRGTWGVSGVVAQCDTTVAVERGASTHSMCPSGFLMMVVLDLWCQLALCCDPDSVVGF